MTVLNTGLVEFHAVQTEAELNQVTVSLAGNLTRLLVVCADTMEYKAFIKTSDDIWKVKGIDDVAFDYDEELDTLKLHIEDDVDAQGDDVWLDVDTDYFEYKLAGIGYAQVKLALQAVYTHGSVNITAAEAAYKTLHYVFHTLEDIGESECTPEGYVLLREFQHKAIASAALDVVDLRFDGVFKGTVDLDLKRAVLNVTHLRGRTSGLHTGYVGEIVTFEGARYGLTPPANLHPCNGSVIDSVFAHPSLKNQNAPDYVGKTLIGSGAGFPVGHDYGQNSTKLVEQHLPELDYTKNAKQYSVSGTVGHNSFNDTDNHVWTYDPDEIGSSWELGGGLGGSTHLYPRIMVSDSDYHNVQLAHSHSFSGSVSIDAVSFSFGRKEPYQTELSLMQASKVVDKYIVIY